MLRLQAVIHKQDSTYLSTAHRKFIIAGLSHGHLINDCLGLRSFTDTKLFPHTNASHHITLPSQGIDMGRIPILMVFLPTQGACYLYLRLTLYLLSKICKYKHALYACLYIHVQSMHTVYFSTCTFSVAYTCTSPLNCIEKYLNKYKFI